MEFCLAIPVRFADIDPAGVVYYPNYFHYCHSVFEEFFGAAHGMSYADWTTKRRIGFPARHVEGDFEAPIRYGDALTMALHIGRIGRTSVEFLFEARVATAAGGAPTRVASFKATKVCVDLASLTPCVIPAELRSVFEKYGGRA
ncbi:MAG: acyl-CoA thioesterase [Planctomycetota bacterium]